MLLLVVAQHCGLTECMTDEDVSRDFIDVLSRIMFQMCDGQTAKPHNAQKHPMAY